MVLNTEGCRLGNLLRAVGAVVFLLLFAGVFSGDAVAARADESKLQMPNRQPTALPVKAPRFREDVLLVMPNRGADKDEIQQVIKECHGQVIETIGEGELTCYVIKVEKGKFVESEKKLIKDKHFSAVQRDYVFQANQVAVNDPFFSSEWHLAALNVVRGWSVSLGGRPTIAVLDTGCNINAVELAGKSYAGFDAVNNRVGQTDVQGHGTMVATTAAANTNNRVATAAPARLAYVYPIRAATANGEFPTTALIKGIQDAGNRGVKILNISANSDPPYSFSNTQAFSVLHPYFRWYHYTKKGLLFVSAGNSGTRDPNPFLPYLQVCTAINPSYTLASFSTYGRNATWTAPGQGIYCSTRDGRVTSVSGTSFSSPLVASIAAMVWGANPNLSNAQVVNILKNTCYKAGNPPRSWTEYYGFGMPNTEAALRAALGR